MVNFFNSLANAGFFTALLTLLIILITSFIVYIYFKILYKPSAFGYPSTMKRTFAFLYDMILLNFSLLLLALIVGIASGTLIEYFKLCFLWNYHNFCCLKLSLRKTNLFNQLKNQRPFGPYSYKIIANRCPKNSFAVLGQFLSLLLNYELF